MADQDDKQNKEEKNVPENSSVFDREAQTESADGGLVADKPEVLLESGEKSTGSVFGGGDFQLMNQNSGNSKRIIFILVIAVVGLALVAGGFLFYNSRVKQAPTPTPTPEVVQSPSPSPTPQAEVEVENLKVQVLNGTGVPGRAGEIKELLEKEGFKNIDTGNAKKYDYTDTEVRLKTATVEGVLEKIKAALINYTVIAGTALEDTDTHDVIVIVGKKNE